MKVVILAGGRGTRIVEESDLKPKPMIEIGGRPILWHIMKIYSAHGLNDFVICCGYKGYMIKEYFANYFLHSSDVTFDIASNRMEVHENKSEPWRVTLIDTGQETMTGGRLRRVREFLGDESFCFTYGDGVSDVDIPSVIAFHREQGKLATVTAIQPPIRYGVLVFDERRIEVGDENRRHVGAFEEKPREGGGWINGGFFVLSPRVIDYIEGDHITWEHGPMQQLVAEGQFSAFLHRGFWYSMDTLRDKMRLESMWASGNPPWKIWD